MMFQFNYSRIFLVTISAFWITFSAAQDCLPEECLWPGDANRNGICNNMDILWIGLGTQDVFGGDSRLDASVTWTPQVPPIDWMGSYPISLINYKYADTNGDAWIDAGDFNIFPNLYGQTNDQFTTLLGDEIPGDDLRLIVSNSNPAPGETVEISIELGSATNPMNNIYGVAFTIDFDTSLIKEDFTTFSNLGGWMNTSEINLHSFAKLDVLVDIVKPVFAFVSQDGQSVSGFGEIAKMSIVVEDIIVGLDGEPVDSIFLDLRFKKVLGLNAQEQDILITSQNHSLLVKETSIEEQAHELNIIQLRNEQKVIIQSKSQIRQAILINMAGQSIYRRNSKDTELEIFTSGIPAGIYLLHIQTKNGVFIHKIPIVNSN